MIKLKGYFDLLVNFRAYFLKLYSIVAESEMRDGEQICLIPNLYLKNYKYLVIRSFLFMITILTGVLYTIVIYVPVELFPVSLTMTLAILFLVTISATVTIIKGTKRDFGKLISTMEIAKQDEYTKKNVKFFYPIVGITILLNFTLFFVNWFYRQELYSTIKSPQIQTVLSSEVSHGCQFGMFVIEVMLIIIVCTLSGYIIFHKAKPILKFCFSQDNTINVNVKMSGVELRQTGSCIRVLNEKKERLFIEDNGIVLIYNEITKEFISYSSQSVTSIAFVK